MKVQALKSSISNEPKPEPPFPTYKTALYISPGPILPTRPDQAQNLKCTRVPNKLITYFVRSDPKPLPKTPQNSPESNQARLALGRMCIWSHLLVEILYSIQESLGGGFKVVKVGSSFLLWMICFKACIFSCSSPFLPKLRFTHTHICADQSCLLRWILECYIFAYFSHEKQKSWTGLALAFL